MKLLFWILGLGAALYVAVCVLLYFQQERLLFFPTKLPADYRFRFNNRFEERWIPMADGTRLHSLLFPADSASKGLIFYLHGNGGALDSWGEVAATYTRLGYSVFLLDYRGYGKSGGRISSQAQLLADVDMAYQQLTHEFPEAQTVLLGYSLGTGPAAWLAARHHPRMLVLQAPYASMRAMARQHYPWVPPFIVRYPLATDEVLPRVSAPIVIYHGDRDEVISPQSTQRLKATLKPRDQFITLPGAGHNDMTDNLVYQQAMRRILTAL
ncbi:alpha/beta hydrolase [Hymenobacter swuensis]|uniref:Alpha/beta hydrolase fold protein n=1 Tax=Hymenobacter swuensis DY53 TaxID=1227739 RepID=W8FAI8_9BACT|nr:alpha/beta fold hydrolase [Hymenobacter swuensis]AHJ99651.1 alpha/beta hydrolase fold protein [Hymenobacter swuensis DY53]